MMIAAQSGLRPPKPTDRRVIIPIWAKPTYAKASVGEGGE
jgi:hypothetical protein